MRKMHFNKTRYLKQIESLDLYLDTYVSFSLSQYWLSRREEGLFSRTTQELNLSKRKFTTGSRQLSLYFVPLKYLICFNFTIIYPLGSTSSVEKGLIVFLQTFYDIFKISKLSVFTSNRSNFSWKADSLTFFLV